MLKFSYMTTQITEVSSKFVLVNHQGVEPLVARFEFCLIHIHN